MELLIKGPSKLSGEVELRGAKNSISKLMVASLLADGATELSSVPDIADVAVVKEMIELLGGKVTYTRSDTLRIEPNGIHSADHKMLRAVDKKSRIPVLFAGPLLARTGEAFIPELGGCDIGPRPVNFHMDALERMGASVERVERGYRVRADRLKGAKIRLPYPSVGATEQVLLSSVLAEGSTELSGAAVEPEILDLVSALQKMGAEIAVDTDRSITIVGVEKLSGVAHTPIPDRLEAASWACAAAATGGEVFVKHARQSEMMTFLNKFRQAGGVFLIQDDGITFSRGDTLRSVTLETNVYPGFSTDWQQPFSVLLTQAKGVSVVHETVYENRFGYTDALRDMGATIELRRECLGGLTCRFGQMNHYHSATIQGPTPLTGRKIVVPDLRAGFAYVIAALIAEGETILEGAHLISRGYERFTEKLQALGVEVTVK